MRLILAQLGGVPNVMYQEGQNAPVTLKLSARFAKITGGQRYTALFGYDLRLKFGLPFYRRPSC